MNDLNQSAEQSYQVDVQLQDPVIRDYCVFEQPTLPFSCLLDLILRIALSRDAKLNEDQTELVINHLHYIRPIVFRGSQKHHLRVVFQPMESEARITKTRITVASAEAAQGSEDQGHWQIYLHCQLETKKLAMEGSARSPLPQSLLRDLDSHKPSDVWPHRIAELQELGLQLGEFYQGQGALWRTEEWLVTRWQLSSLAAGYGHSFLLHPAWLTAALLMPLGEAAMVRRGIPLVSEVASCRVWRPGVAIDYAAIPLPWSQDRFDLLLLSADGQLVASLGGCAVSWVQNGADFLGRSGPAAVGPGLDRLSDLLGAGWSRPVTFTSADPMLRDHRVRSLGVVPGGYFLTMLLAAGAAGASAPSRSQWRDVRFLAPAVVDRDPLTVVLQTGGQGAEGEIFQIVDSAGQVFCRATHGGPAKSAPALWEQAPELTAQTMAAATVYDAIALRQFFLGRGLDYGSSCQCLTQVTVLQDWAWGEVRETGGEDWAIVDAAFQVAATLLASGANPVGALPQPAGSLNSHAPQREPKPEPPLEPLLVPYGIDACWLDGSLVDVRRIGVRCTHRRSRGGQFDLMGLDRHGNQVFLIQGGRLQMAQWQPAQGPQTTAPHSAPPDREPPSEPIDPEPLRWFQPQWRPCPVPNLASGTALEETGWGLLCSAQGPVPAVIREAVSLAHRGQVLEQWPDRPDSAPTITTVWYWPAIGEEGPILLWRFLKTLQERFPSPTPLALRVITTGAAAVEPTETPQPDAAAIVALLHSLAAESPHWQVGRVDVDETWLANGQASSLLAALAINLSAASQRCELALRSSGLYRRDLVAIPAPPTSATPSPLPLRPGGVYVIAGGAGGIGAALAQRWAAKIPGLRLVLLGRRPLDAAIQELLQALTTAGATATYEAVDITDAAAIESLFATLRSRYGAIHGVIHSALVLRDGLLAQMSETDFQVAFGVKSAGIRALAQATVLDRLDFFACFSSLNSFLGNAGQGNYVAGCAYQDAYMTQMQRQRPAVHWVVCNWGYWGESGRVTAPMYRKRLQRLGIGAIGTEEGLAAFEQLLASDATQVAIFRGTDALCDRLGCVARSPEASESDPIVTMGAPPAPDRPEIASALSSPIAPSTASPVTQPTVNISALEVQIRGLVADCLEVAPEEIEAEGRFADYGLDSISAVDLIRSVNQAFGLELRTTVLFDYPTARSLAQHLQTLPNLQAPLESVPAAVAPPNLATPNPLAAPVASVSPAAPALPSLDGLETQVRGLVADCLEIAPEEIEAEGRFADYGLDSISAVDLIRSVNQAFGLELRTTVLFDYPTVRSLAQHLQTLLPALLPMAVAPTADPVASQPNFTQPNFTQPNFTQPDPETRPAAGSPIAPPIPDNSPPVSVPSPTPARPRAARSTAAAIPEVDFSSLTFPRAVWLTQPGSVAQVQWRSQPITPPAADQVQIAVRAAALNFGDLLCIKGLYPTMPSYPMTPGFEVSGEIIALGANVQNFQVGDQVMALLGESLGGLAEVVNADAVLAVRKPATVSHETAAAFPVTWLTAHQAIERARLQPGERILIQTAAGATGLHAVRMALAIGAEVFATAGSAHKLDYLRQIGVHHVIAYRDLDFQTEVMRLSEGRGVDVVINTLAGDAIPKGLRCLAPGGRYVELAMTAWKTSAALDLSTLVDNQSVLSLDLRRWFLRRSPEVPLALEEMAQALAQGAGEGMVDRTFSLAEVRSALAYLESRQSIGKVVITMPTPPAPSARNLRRGSDSAALEGVMEGADRAMPEPIAIVGMSGRFPDAPTLNDFWQNLQRGVGSCGPVPPDRWDPEALATQTGDPDYHHYCRVGAFLDRVHDWDPLFFRITGAEAQLMSPEQRLFLTEAWQALEDAGIPDRQLNGSDCGIFVAAGTGDYDRWLEQGGVNPDGHVLIGNNVAILGARLAYFLNLQGPCLTLNTACSSSLVAIDLACQSLRSGRCQTAIAGGTFLMHTPQIHLLCGKAGMVSPSGQLRAFAAGADGFVPGEGIAVVVLKRLRDALAEGDRIHGVIRSISVNQDGLSNGITAPNSQSQSALLRRVYAEADIDPATITYVEAHGTGTALGDSIEFEAITRVFRDKTAANEFCALGFGKTNIGHTIYTAGLASLLKVLLAFKHQQIPPSANFETPNPDIRWADSPFYVNRELRPWQPPAGIPRRAAVSSFGFSGTNCHLVLDEPPAVAPARLNPAGHAPIAELFVVSAKSEAALQRRCQDLADFLTANPQLSLRRLAANLATRRSHFRYRVAWVADQPATLQAYLLAQATAPCAGVEPSAAPIAAAGLLAGAAIATGAGRWQVLESLGELYRAGHDLDWERLYSKVVAYPLDLPAYPWLPVRCSPQFAQASSLPVVSGAEDGASARALDRPVDPPVAPPIDPPVAPVAHQSADLPIDPPAAHQSVDRSSPEQDTAYISALAQVRHLLATTLAIPPDLLTRFEPWNRFGLDSLLIKKLNTRLSQTFGPVPPSLFFERRNLHELTLFLQQTYPEHFAESLAGSELPDLAESSELPKNQEPPNPPQATQDIGMQTNGAHEVNGIQANGIHETNGTHANGTHAQAIAPTGTNPQAEPRSLEIAVIGMAGRYPGAPTLQDFWQQLAAGQEAIQEVPPDRWNHDLIYDPDPHNPTTSYTRWGSFLDQVDRFDALFFGISPKEAEAMDPQERLFLEVCWHALEDAAYAPSRLMDSQGQGPKGGVFAGVIWGSYQLLAAEAWAQGRVVSVGPSHWGVANRVSHVLNWHGPSLTVDTACSSSLVAVHLACEAIRRGECDLALAGGVNLYLHPSKFVTMSQLQFASRDGRCRSFGAGGDGYGAGEGVGAVVLKPLAQARADGDRIYGIIQGSSVTHGGRTHGYTVPNPLAQSAAIAQALDQSGFAPETVSYIEAHGTGTELGDPVEMAALSRVLGGNRPTPCAIGSVKSNIGHAESAAGVAGLIKVLLQMQHGQLVPSLHADPPNPAIAFAEMGFRVQRQLAPWVPVAGVRRAGVSSFGAGGVNAHLLLESVTDAQGQPSGPAPTDQTAQVLIPLSAANPDRLRVLVADLEADLAAHPDRPLGAIAATLQRGREPLGTRLAVVTQSVEQLRQSLRSWLAGQPDQWTFSGQLPSQRIQAPPALMHDCCSVTQTLLEQGDWLAVAPRWVAGNEVSWPAVGEIISLPGYPFAPERHWLSAGEPMRHPQHPELPVVEGVVLAQRVWRNDVDALGGAGRGAIVPSEPMTLVLSCPEGQAAAWAETLRHRYPAATVIQNPAPSQTLPPGPLQGWYVGSGDEIESLLGLLRFSQTFSQRLVDDRPLTLVAIAPNPTAAMQAAFLRTLVAEYPHWAAVSLAIGELPTEPTLAWPPEVPLPHPGQARELALHNGHWQECRLVEIALDPSALSDSRSPGPGWRNGGVYLITGGFGGLGQLLARYLAREFQARLILLGRQRLDRERVRFIQEIQSLGGEAIYLSADLTCSESLDEALRRARQRFGPLQGVIHGAGVLADQAVALKDEASFRQVLAPKVTGTRRLAAATATDPLDFFLLFSSLVSVLGNPGQGDYAAANAFLNEFAAQDPRRWVIGLPLWQDGGMQIPAEHLHHLRQTIGLAPMPTEAGLALLTAWLAAGPAALVAAWGDRALLRRFLGLESQPESPSALQSTARSGLASNPQPAQTPNHAPNHDWGSHPAAAQESLQTELRTLFGRELKIAPERLDPEAGLDIYGLDSVAVRRLTAQLETRFGPLPKTLLFHHRTLRSLAEHLQARSPQPAIAPVAASANPDPLPLAAAPVDREATPEPIAIIGCHGRFPGAETLDHLWTLLVQGGESITDVPPDRWDHSLFYDPQPGKLGKTYARWGGFLDQVDQFDPLFFGITPKDAELMDPQERLFLESAWLALENAGYRPDALDSDDPDRPHATGVFAGVTWGSYHLLALDAWRAGLPSFPNSSFWSVANRVSYTLNLQGPSMPVDTACSASLSAIHLACESLRRGECQLAIAGGVNLYLHPVKYVQMAHLRFASTDGKCRSFGAGGDGYVPGEGVGTVILKPLAAALRDRDPIQAVIRGSAMNHGGKTNGYTVPNPQAQAQVVRLALERAQLDAHHLSYLEAHGTGTALGDPIEMDGLQLTFARDAQVQPGHCAIGSIKSNIGHLESAAGIAGLCKILLQLKHRQLVPSLHSDRPNPAIDFAHSPFRLQRTRSPWAGPSPLRAGLSSFGAGGSNAHLIVEEAPANVRSGSESPRSAPAELIILSARTPQLLRITAQNLANFLQNHPTVTLADVAFTLQVGRRPAAQRLAILVDSIAQLQRVLTAYGQGQTQNDGTTNRWLGEVQPGQPVPPPLTAVDLADQSALSALAQHWIQGGSVDWTALPRPVSPVRLALPGSPFDRRRCWIPLPETVSPPLAPGGLAPESPPVLPDMTNGEQAPAPDRPWSVSQTIDSHNPIAQEHQVSGRPTLPGSALLDLVAETIRQGNGAAAWGTVGGFAEVTWMRRAEVPDQGLTLRVALTASADRIRFTVENAQGIAYASGQALRAIERPPALPAEFADLLGAKGQPLSIQEFYEIFDQTGVAYGPNFRGVQQVEWLPGGTRAQLAIPPLTAPVFSPMGQRLDMVWQTVQAELQRQSDHHQLWLPFMVESVQWFGPWPAAGTVLVRSSPLGSASATAADEQALRRFHLALLDPQGQLVAIIRNFCVKAVKASSAVQPVQAVVPSALPPPSLERELLTVLAELAQGEQSLEETDRQLATLLSRAVKVEP
ncbi:SDR family NAD(P)-dependent oxidoreductase [Limnothrix sp. FACHB-881]|nr:SDR family NAD(P)-dependent oxidoreductase [Limnothrix sp. FACHB-881]MBD2636146.1 SDR family NAD(P)-dependent oxidoreductase [Limnothrix sp. FACHB-881]